jgi:predicted short-subunit dehydrogenase-like oxidoreductase (DUF2520 family)
MRQPIPVTILGTGNVARVLAHAFTSAGNPITEIWGRNHNAALELATELQSAVAEDIRKIRQHDGIYLIAVSDQAIESVAQQMPFVKGVVAHTSGSTYLKVLSDKFLKSGVFYPLQTFSKLNPPVIEKVPFIIQGSEDWAQEVLKSAVEILGSKAFFMTEEQRIKYHLSAVMVNNFSNHLITLTQDFLNAEGLPSNLIYPLLEQTVNNVINNNAGELQTGPARRGDLNTINTHLTILKDVENPFLEQIYRLFSESIRAYYPQSK